MANVAQYLLVVNNAKGFPKFSLHPNGGEPIDVLNDLNWNSSIAAGPSIDIQLSEPDEINTFTIQISEP